MQVKAKSLAFGGEAICQCTDASFPEQKKIFVAGLIPDEIGEVTITSDEKSLARATLLSVLESSPKRVEAPCLYYQECGGCNLQHIQIDAQRQLKLDMVESMLFHQARLRPKQPIKLIGSQLPAFHYRKRLALHLSPHGKLGFYRKGSHELVDIEACLLAQDELNHALQALRAVRFKLCSQVGKIAIDTDRLGVIVALELRDSASADTSKLLKTVSALDLRAQIKKHGKFLNDAQSSDHIYPAGHFSQVNPAANLLLLEHVLGAIKGQVITELYAGAGNFSIPLAQSGKTVQMVETDQELLKMAKSRIEELSLCSKVNLINQSAEQFSRKNQFSESLLLDPPRSGAKEALKRVDPKITKEIVYVSCNLPTLCRDLRCLAERGYVLEKVSVLDMFAQTHYVEVICELQSTQCAPQSESAFFD